MATFQAQVEGITQLSVGTTPTTGELSQFLKDGVIDVTNRWLAVKPQDSESFQRVSSTSDSQGVSVGGAKIISVIREANADGSADGSIVWERCRKISSGMQSRVVDPDSLSFASIYNPVYIMNSDKTINVYPVPSANNGFKVYYINEEPRDITNNVALAFSHENIKYFPNDKVYLVVLYASMKTLQAAMGATTISDLSVTSVPPAVPTISSISVTITGTAPTYTAPTISGDGTEITGMSNLDGDDTIDVHADQFEFDQWFATAGHLIEGEEDTELAQAQLQKIQTYIQAYGQAIQNQLNVFNDANTEYQATLQKNLKDADFDNQEDERKLKRYQAELQEYQAEVQAQIGEYTQNLQADVSGYQWLQGQYAALKEEYDKAFMIVAPKQQPQQAKT